VSSKVTRRQMLGGSVAGMAAFLLAACGGTASPTSAPVPTATKVASSATTAPATGAGATATTGGSAGGAVSSATAVRATASAAAGGSPAASTGTGVLKPNTTANAFSGKKLGYFQKVQYYKAVQDQIGNSIRDYTKSVGGDVELAVASTDSAANLAKVQAGVQSGSPFDLADDIGPGIGQLITLNLLEDVTDVVNHTVPRCRSSRAA